MKLQKTFQGCTIVYVGVDFLQFQVCKVCINNTNHTKCLKFVITSSEFLLLCYCFTYTLNSYGSSKFAAGMIFEMYSSILSIKINKNDQISYIAYLIVTRRRRMRTIEMTSSVCVSVRPSVIPSVLSSDQNHPCSPSQVFHRIDLKLYRLSSNNIKLCIQFLIFVTAIYDGVPTLAESDLALATTAIFFNQIALKLCRMFYHDLKLCTYFGILSV